MRPVLAAIAGIALAIALIVRGRLHPFVVRFSAGAFAIGPLGGLSMADTAKAVQKARRRYPRRHGSRGGALGLALGSMLQLSNGAAGLARLDDRRSRSAAGALDEPARRARNRPAAVLRDRARAAAADHRECGGWLLPESPGRDGRKLELMMSALAGLFVVHALVPPHPGPLIAIGALGANLGLTIGYGLLVAVPTAILAGPLFARFATRNVALAAVTPVAPVFEDRGVPVWRALLAVLLPVLLILAGQVEALLPPAFAPRVALALHGEQSGAGSADRVSSPCRCCSAHACARPPYNRRSGSKR